MVTFFVLVGGLQAFHRTRIGSGIFERRFFHAVVAPPMFFVVGVDSFVSCSCGASDSHVWCLFVFYLRRLQALCGWCGLPQVRYFYCFF